MIRKSLKIKLIVYCPISLDGMRDLYHTYFTNTHKSITSPKCPTQSLPTRIIAEKDVSGWD
jgi:hypothetical protein